MNDECIYLIYAYRHSNIKSPESLARTFSGVETRPRRATCGSREEVQEVLPILMPKDFFPRSSAEGPEDSCPRTTLEATGNVHIDNAIVYLAHILVDINRFLYTPT